nr:hypothetical protein [uncultured Devosia sp.]
MRHLEAFTLGKKFGQPETNEDSLVVMPNLGYAVIDGVTDRNGTRYGGMLSGQFASRTVKRATELFLLAQGDARQPELQFRGGEHFVHYLGKAIFDGYVANGAVAAVEADWKLRGGCTIMAAMLIGDRLEVVAVGDSGIRINGNDTIQVLKPLDDVTAILRRETWHYFEALGGSTEECDRNAASMTWQGTRNQPKGSSTDNPNLVATLEARALAASRQHLPNVPESELLELIQHGIAHGQGNFQNVTEPVLGYGGIDGFSVPNRYIETRSYPLVEVETIELFSDGYFKPGDGFGVASWEAAFQEVEAEDFHKIGRYMSTKGTTSTQLTDDRSYLGVRLK